MSDKRVTVPLFTLLVLVVSLILVSAVLAAGGPVTQVTRLSGAKEVPGPGDPDGSGEATIKVSLGMQSVCWDLEVADIADATAAHIHAGNSTVAGPVVVALSPPTGGSSSGCAEGVDKGLIRNMIRHPSQYYVNVHNAEYPGGAVRGQLRTAP